MKNREEYIESIYKKRDEALELRKKRRSYLTCAACIAVCFLTAFFLIPKDSPEIKEEPYYTSESSLNEISNNAVPEDFVTLPAADGTVGFVEETEGNLRENKTTASFGGTDTSKKENLQSCTVASSAPQQTASPSTTKAVKTTTHKNDTSKNDVVGAGDSIIDIEDVIDGLGSIELPEFTINGNIIGGYRHEGFGSSLGSSPPSTTKPIEEAPPAPDTGGDNYTGVLIVAHSYLADNELKQIDSAKTEISFEDSPTDSAGNTSSASYAYYVSFQTDTKTIIIILDADTLNFLGREEYPQSKQTEESTALPQTTVTQSAASQETEISESTTVTNVVTENS